MAIPATTARQGLATSPMTVPIRIPTTSALPMPAMTDDDNVRCLRMAWTPTPIPTARPIATMPTTTTTASATAPIRRLIDPDVCGDTTTIQLRRLRSRHRRLRTAGRQRRSSTTDLDGDRFRRHLRRRRHLPWRYLRRLLLGALMTSPTTAPIPIPMVTCRLRAMPTTTTIRCRWMCSDSGDR